MAVAAGQTLRDKKIAPTIKSYRCIGAGICILAVGYAISVQIPIIKNLWTASYVLVAGGWSLVLLGLTHRLMDVAGYIHWASAGVWTGANAILIYALDGFIEIDHLILRLAGNETVAGLDALFLPGTGRLMASTISLGLLIALARTLYVRGLFLRL
ncbi:MAG: hypothetical protein AAF732_20285 [Pseudomonadota bacterium]